MTAGMGPADRSPTADASARAAEAAALMAGFAERTGLSSERAPRRYLWTDAFAVCNFLGLARATGEARYAALALRLVDQVHHTLGRRRRDDLRPGWLSGLDGAEAERHPTRGGLRIGKPLAERDPDEPFDETLEWDRDGQYFHYLTQWMHALDQAARASGRPQLNLWARELAQTAHRRFVHVLGERPRLYWKMSVDLSRPLVTSMGQHDALDGFVACTELRATAARLPAEGPALDDELRSLAAMVAPDQLATADPLGLGALLVDADRLEQVAPGDRRLRDVLVCAADVGLEYYSRQPELRRPAEQRLAFRELGLAIGLCAAAALRARSGSDEPGLDELARFDALGADLVRFWLAPEHRRARPFDEHRDINEVMLATALLPDGFLIVDEPRARGSTEATRPG
jgi:hypothetical protein